MYLITEYSTQIRSTCNQMVFQVKYHLLGFMEEWGLLLIFFTGILINFNAIIAGSAPVPGKSKASQLSLDLSTICCE